MCPPQTRFSLSFPQIFKETSNPAKIVQDAAPHGERTSSGKKTEQNIGSCLQKTIFFDATKFSICLYQAMLLDQVSL